MLNPINEKKRSKTLIDSNLYLIVSSAFYSMFNTVKTQIMNIYNNLESSYIKNTDTNTILNKSTLKSLLNYTDLEVGNSTAVKNFIDSLPQDPNINGNAPKFRVYGENEAIPKQLIYTKKDSHAINIKLRPIAEQASTFSNTGGCVYDRMNSLYIIYGGPSYGNNTTIKYISKIDFSVNTLNVTGNIKKAIYVESDNKVYYFIYDGTDTLVKTMDTIGTLTTKITITGENVVGATYSRELSTLAFTTASGKMYYSNDILTTYTQFNHASLSGVTSLVDIEWIPEVYKFITYAPSNYNVISTDLKTFVHTKDITEIKPTYQISSASIYYNTELGSVVVRDNILPDVLINSSDGYNWTIYELEKVYPYDPFAKAGNSGVYFDTNGDLIYYKNKSRMFITTMHIDGSGQITGHRYGVHIEESDEIFVAYLDGSSVIYNIHYEDTPLIVSNLRRDIFKGIKITSTGQDNAISWNDVVLDNFGDLYAVGGGGSSSNRVIKSTNGGKLWVVENTSLSPSDLIGVSNISGNVVAVTGGQDIISNAGVGWSYSTGGPSGGGNNILSIHKNVITTTDATNNRYTSTNGDTWTLSPVPIGGKSIKRIEDERTLEYIDIFNIGSNRPCYIYNTPLGYMSRDMGSFMEDINLSAAIQWNDIAISPSLLTTVVCGNGSVSIISEKLNSLKILEDSNCNYFRVIWSEDCCEFFMAANYAASCKLLRSKDGYSWTVVDTIASTNIACLYWNKVNKNLIVTCSTGANRIFVYY